MYPKVARVLTFLVVLLMLLQTVGGQPAAVRSGQGHHVTFHSQKAPSSILGSFVIEKTEEETEFASEGKDRMVRVLLIDFTRITFSLSSHHTPLAHFPVPALKYDVRPPVHERNRVFLI